MNKALSKAVMNRSRLRNKFLKDPDNTNKLNYTKYRNYCTKLFRKVKKKYYNNLDIKLVVDNKTFWKTVKPLFSEKHFSNNKITLVEDDEIISTDNEITLVEDDEIISIDNKITLVEDDEIISTDNEITLVVF